MRTGCFEATPAWKHALQNPNCACHLLLLACYQDCLVGWSRLFPTSVTGEAEIGIGLRSPHQNRGVGTAMLKQTIAWANQQPLTRLVLNTNSGNLRAIHLFQKCAFSFSGQIEAKWIEMEYLTGITGPV